MYPGQGLSSKGPALYPATPGTLSGPSVQTRPAGMEPDYLSYGSDTLSSCFLSGLGLFSVVVSQVSLPKINFYCSDLVSAEPVI